MKSLPVLTALCTLYLHAVLGIGENTAFNNTGSPNVALKNKDNSPNIALDNTGSPKIAPTDTELPVTAAVNIGPSSVAFSDTDISNAENLWFLLESVLSSFLIDEKNKQGTGIMPITVKCPLSKTERFIDGNKYCLDLPSKDYYDYKDEQ